MGWGHHNNNVANLKKIPESLIFSFWVNFIDTSSAHIKDTTLESVESYHSKGAQNIRSRRIQGVLKKGQSYRYTNVLQEGYKESVE